MMPAMTTETARKRRRTTMVPMTTMEEIPVLDDNERTELLGALKGAEADIKAGKGSGYDSRTFLDRLLRIYRECEFIRVRAVRCLRGVVLRRQRFAPGR
jgi:hypothetical protein